MKCEKPTSVRFLVLASLCAAAAIVYIQRQALGNAESTMRNELGLSKETMGLVLSIWLWTYAALQIPGGWLGDRWGSQRALPLYCLIWSICTMLTGFLTWLPALLFVRLVFGAAHAGLFPCTAIILKRWFPEEKRGLATGWIAAFQQVGAAVASFAAGEWLTLSLGFSQPAWVKAEGISIPPLPEWIRHSSEFAQNSLRMVFDWRAMFFWFSVPGVLWSLWFWRWFRDRPSEHPRVNEAELALLPQEDHATEPTRSSLGDESMETASIWRSMAVSSTMWLICGQQFFRAAGYFFYQSWFPTFLQKSRGVTIEKSGSFTSIMFIAALVGSLSGGGISDWILRRTGSRRLAKQGVAIVGLLGASILAAAAYFVRSPDLAVVVLAAGSFCAAAAGPSAYSVTIDIAGKNTATVFGTMNMSGNIGAAILPMLVPLLVDGAERFHLKDRVGLSGWDLVLFVFAAVYLAGAVCWLFVNPHETIGRRNQQIAEPTEASNV